MGRYGELKDELPAMAELLKLFPDEAQGKVLEALLGAFIEVATGAEVGSEPGPPIVVSAPRGKRAAKAYPCTVVKGLDLGEAGDVVSFEEFARSKNPVSRVDKVAVAVYYLKQLRKIERVGINHVFTCFLAVKEWRKPTNLRGWVWEASSNRYGYVDARVAEDLQLSMMGLNLVEKELPRI